MKASAFIRLALLSFVLPLMTHAQPPSGALAPGAKAGSPTIAQTPVQASSALYRNELLQLSYRYPAELKQQTVNSFQEAMDRGHRRHLLTAPGSDGDGVLTASCIHVLFSAKTTEPSIAAPSIAAPPLAAPPATARHRAAETATAAAPPVGLLIVSEFEPGCAPTGVSPSEMLGSLASMPSQIPGFQIIGDQMWYELDKHKVHFSSAQGSFASEQHPSPFLVGVASVEVHGHMLFWLFLADDTAMFNHLLSSQVQFDSGPKAPLMPLTLGYGEAVKLLP